MGDPGRAPVSDDALLQAVAGGDEQAYSQLVHRHGDRLYGYLLRLTRCASDAEDLLQDTFVKVWRRAGSYQPGRVQAGTWLHRIAHNLYVDSFRRNRRRAEVVLADNPDEASAGQSVELESALLASERLHQVERALSALPANQRAAIILCQLQGMSNADAAIVLGVGTRALESLLARARRSLRAATELSTEHGDGDD